MNGAAATAVRLFPELGRLAELEAAGWSFIHHRDGEGVKQVDAFRSWPGGWLDCLRVRSATEAMGLRSNGGDPPGLLWERTGALAEVVEALIGLPAPGARTAPRLVLGTAPQLWMPGSRR
ncbi:hypothetical protein ALI22I_35370 [Saccharothrix sp. ALI-22-I]|uniref:hypothetical protein n=1 Tax=Saccharothrix sp. ALI-22-I TaxID=1933778 RepID=UPI00097C40DD|nr:hypothetical protein [Saccharothrix sp. ALI-22-I]ONI83738.1 hypothetical protein ALI22I_35370 [Saccharothrix sp. ALI-22-I]